MKHDEKFKSLNLEWLDRYFKVEPIDELVLNNPEREIVDKGGFIFMIQKNYNYSIFSSTAQFK